MPDRCRKVDWIRHNKQAVGANQYPANSKAEAVNCLESKMGFPNHPGGEAKKRAVSSQTVTPG